MDHHEPIPLPTVPSPMHNPYHSSIDLSLGSPSESNDNNGIVVSFDQPETISSSSSIERFDSEPSVANTPTSGNISYVSASTSSNFSTVGGPIHFSSFRHTNPLLTRAEIMQVFHRNQLFPSMNDGTLEQLIGTMKTVTCVPGQLIYLEGDYSNRTLSSCSSSPLSIPNEGPGAIAQPITVSNPDRTIPPQNVAPLGHYALYIVIQGSCEVRTRTNTFYMKKLSLSEIITDDHNRLRNGNTLGGTTLDTSLLGPIPNLSSSLKVKKRRSTWLLQFGDIFGELALVADHFRKETVRSGPYGAKLLVLTQSCKYMLSSGSIPGFVTIPPSPSSYPHFHPPSPVTHSPSTTSLNKDIRTVQPSSNVSGSAFSSSSSSVLGIRPLLSELQHIRTIGIGSFGKVTLVRALRTNKIYALKCIHRSGQTGLPNSYQALFMEQWVLQHIHHPFLLGLITSYEDTANIYLLTEYVSGGELFSLLAPPDEGGIGPSLSFVHGRFIIACLIDALAYLHSPSLGKLVYRDLKLENILLDSEGYIKLCDFGFTTQLLSRKNQRAVTLCGTPEYLAPEIIQQSTNGSNQSESSINTDPTRQLGYTEVIDWWSLGILTYEILVGYTPFADAVESSGSSLPVTNNVDANSSGNGGTNGKQLVYNNNPISIFRRILQGKIHFPDTFTDYHARDFIRQLLIRNPQERLGYVSSDQVRHHPWFTSSLSVLPRQHHNTMTIDPTTIDPTLYEPLDWDKLRTKGYTAPWKPILDSPEDAHYFDQYSDHERESIHEKSTNVFEDF